MVDLLTAAETAIAVMRQHNLTSNSFGVTPGQPGAKGWNSEEQAYTRPILTEIQLSMFNAPAKFLRWAEHLDIERIWVQRRDYDTCLHANTDRDGLRWSIHTSARRPLAGRHLPGITVDWERQPSGRRGNSAWITLPDLRATFTSLDVAS